MKYPIVASIIAPRIDTLTITAVIDILINQSVIHSFIGECEMMYDGTYDCFGYQVENERM